MRGTSRAALRETEIPERGECPRPILNWPWPQLAEEQPAEATEFRRVFNGTSEEWEEMEKVERLSVGIEGTLLCE